MAQLMKAHDELFRRSPDERFPTLNALYQHCVQTKRESQTRWQDPQTLSPCAIDDRLALQIDGEEHQLNDWSFSQLCRLAEVNRETVNRLSPATACSVLRETLPAGNKPLQVLTTNRVSRSIHGVSYTRLFNADVLSLVVEWATNFRAPQEGAGGGTGLYCGEQDMFCFLVDPTGWVEIGKEAFAPGFFIWNSEVGRRTVGIQSFWFQAVCQNHIVWDATDVIEFSRKHTSNVHDALEQIRLIMENLIARRDQSRDGFVRMVKKAMKYQLEGADEEILRVLLDHGVGQALAKATLEAAQKHGRLTVFALVDALTRLSQERFANGGDRAEIDQKAGRLLALAA